MLKHVATLGMFAIAGLLFAIGSSAPTNLICFAVLGVAIGVEATAWHRVARARRHERGPGIRSHH